jgi:uncharacterized protein YjbI with pentapeptide repeats
MPQVGRRALRSAALGLAGLVGLVGVILLVWWVPPALYGNVRDEQARVNGEATTRTGLIAGLAGLAALGSLAMTTRTYRLTQQGQIADRYTKAIEQLGSAKLDVRLGGLYALERIAVDSGRDHPTVVEVLSAFVREHSDPTHADSAPTVAEVLSAFLREDDNEPADMSQPEVGSDKKPKPATDVQAAVTMLGRLPRRPDVSRGDLSEAHLAGAELKEANLTDADLNGADLTDADLDRATLTNAELNRAHLTGAGLNEADLSGAQLNRADLSGAELGATKLPGAQLVGAKLSGAQLDNADLSGAQLVGADLSGAELGGADLSGAQLGGAKLEGALGLTQEELDSARGHATTRLPDGVGRPASWTASQD